MDYSKEEHIPPGAGGGGGQWRVFCKLSWSDEIFPQPGYGIVNGQQAPSFAVKKVILAPQVDFAYVTFGINTDWALFSRPQSTSLPKWQWTFLPTKRPLEL